MKCNQAEKLMLLKQCAQLSWFNKLRLKLHLGACEKCRQYYNILNELTNNTHKAFNNIVVPKEIISNINTAAYNENIQKKEIFQKQIFYLTSLKWLLAGASTAAVLFGLNVWLNIYPSTESDKFAQEPEINFMIEICDSTNINGQGNESFTEIIEVEKLNNISRAEKEALILDGLAI
jgi:predicted anti-sigma-YlaC factor YlaD